jgi:uncharacterized protein YutE (UPF0331/DUF86 family)
MTPKNLDPATVQAKLRLLDELLDALRGLGEVSGDRLRSDQIVRLAVERVLTQGVDLVAAVCTHVVSAQGHRTAATYRAAVQDAAAVGLVSTELADLLASAVGLRNLLVHEYVQVDLDLLAQAVPAALHDFGAFVAQTARWLGEHE